MTVKSPVHVVAATSEPVLRMEVWADGNKVGDVPGNVVDTNLSMGSGQHNINVTAVEVDTSSFTGQTNFNIDPPPPPPVPSDFAVSVSPATQSVKHGQSATYAVSVAAQDGAFNNAVSLSCSGLPKGTSCSFVPGTVTPGATTATATLILSTSVSTASSMATPVFRTFAVGYALLLPLAAFVGAKRWKLPHRLRIFCLVLVAGMALQGCGGGGASQQISSQSGASVIPVPPDSGGGTPTATPTTSTVMIVATSGTTTHSTAITLTVQ
jgi:hypothetical protein